MGWWRNQDGDQIGDDSADVASEHLEKLAEHKKPSLGELLAHLRVVLATKADDLLAQGEPRPQTLDADVERPDGTIERVSEAGGIDPSLRDAVDEMCAAISERYGAFLDRRPTLREVLASIKFVLAHEPDRLLNIAEDSSVQRIYARS